MASFEPIVRKVGVAEGGYSTNLQDSGNYASASCGGGFVGTNHGIAAKTLEAYYEECVTVAQMKALTKGEAKAIYKQNYWNIIGGDYINSDNVAHAVFDTLVLRPAWVPTIVGAVLENNGIYTPISLPFTITMINAINSVPADKMFEQLKEERKGLHVQLYDKAAAAGRTKDTSYTYYDGYLKRCDNLGGFSSANGFQRNAYGIEDTGIAEGTEVCELYPADPALLEEIIHVDSLGINLWDKYKFFILGGVAILMLAGGIYQLKKK